MRPELKNTEPAGGKARLGCTPGRSGPSAPTPLGFCTHLLDHEHVATGDLWDLLSGLASTERWGP